MPNKPIIFIDNDEGAESTIELECSVNVMCGACEGAGVLIERECCWNADYIQKYGCCCDVPNPVQVQCNYCYGEGSSKPL